MNDDIKDKMINLFRLLLRLSNNCDITAMQYILSCGHNSKDFNKFMDGLTFFYHYYLDLKSETLNSKDLCSSDKALFRLFKSAKRLNDDEDIEDQSIDNNSNVA